ncbi:N-acyl amino acid synthase FeeM domain-containing protein [Dechloromonas denitrificans]|uniref:N-acyl amino acid synthase FeeM domain-containing protein n=1 Tax=Dechloromonas denitrificans TaxID=281362 RepID=UPI001CFBBEEF|nr:hypothetical protein [Dechloromonas denitrificans]UCV08987.1 hypothetical protein KI615_05520 [Dechloromonas denitrificans]
MQTHNKLVCRSASQLARENRACQWLICSAAGGGSSLITRDGVIFGIPDRFQQDAIHALVCRMYARRGIQPPPHPDSSSCLTHLPLAAWHAGMPVGTLTLRNESTGSLLAEELYAAEIDKLRRRGAHLCEITRLAVAPGEKARKVLATLFHLLCLIARQARVVTDAVIEVHPRHARCYSRLAGFKTIGGLRICQRVAAPAVLMHAQIGGIQEQLARHLQGSDDERSASPAGGLHRHLLSPSEESFLLRRLAGRQLSPGCQMGLPCQAMPTQIDLIADMASRFN